MPRRNNTPKIVKSTPYVARSCTNKRRFSNKLSATRQAEVQMLQQLNLSLSVYQCAQCGGWHLTSSK